MEFETNAHYVIWRFICNANIRYIAFMIVIVTIGLALFVTLTFYYSHIYYDDTDSSFPFYCQMINAPPYDVYSGSLILLFDFVCSIASMIAFIGPLNKIRRAMQANNPKAYGEKTKKMKAIGYQYKVLVIAGSTTTLLWISLVFAQQIALATFFINCDYLFNCIVMCFMSSYYPRDKYYERFCFFCICLCGNRSGSKEQRKGYKSSASRRHLDPDATRAFTADTSSMFEHSRLHALLYGQVDVDNDGRIDCAELAEACNISKDEAQDIINKHDVDGDGKLDREEFEMLQQQIMHKKEEEVDEAKELLTKWGLAQYWNILVENGYEKLEYWMYLVEPANKLKEFGFKDGHMHHFLKKYKECKDTFTNDEEEKVHAITKTPVIELGGIKRKQTESIEIVYKRDSVKL